MVTKLFGNSWSIGSFFTSLKEYSYVPTIFFGGISLDDF